MARKLTATQIRILQLAKRLKPLSPKQERFALAAGDYARNDRRRTFYAVFSVVSRIDRFMLVRHFMVWHTNYKRKENNAHIEGEVLRQWISMDTKLVVLQSKPLNGFAYWLYQPFRLGEDWRFVQKLSSTGWHEIWGDVYVSSVHRDCYFTKEQIRKAGDKMSPLFVIIDCARDPFYEQMVKTGHEEFLHLYRQRVRYQNVNLEDLKAAFNIAVRHGFDVDKDAATWLDHYKTLCDLGLDTRNPHYVAPANMHEQHMQLVARLNHQRQREQAMRTYVSRLKDSEKKEEFFEKLRGPYLAIAFGDDKYQVHVLQSVKEYVEEGQAMHHCVGSLDYWSRPNSICLSVRDNEGRRVTTCEMSLCNGSVLQNYAACDKKHPDDANIRKLITSNFYRFKEAKCDAKYKKAA